MERQREGDTKRMRDEENKRQRDGETERLRDTERKSYNIKLILNCLFRSRKTGRQ